MFVVVVGDSSETLISRATFSIACRPVYSLGQPLDSTVHFFCRSFSYRFLFRYLVLERHG